MSEALKMTCTQIAFIFELLKALGVAGTTKSEFDHKSQHALILANDFACSFYMNYDKNL